MDRRTFLSGTAAALAVMAAPPARSRRIARIVLPLPLTGPQAVLGRMLHGTALAAVDAANRAGLGGHAAVAVQVEDTRSDPSRFEMLVRQFATGDGRPAAVFGCCPDDLRPGLGAWLDSVDGVLWDPQGYEGGECSAGIVHFGPTPYQSLSQALPFLAAEVGRRFLVVGGDGPRAAGLARVARWAVGRMDAELVGEGNAENRLAWLGRARRERVDVIVCTLEGAALAAYLQAYAAARLDPLNIPMLCPAMTELEVAQAGPALAAGHVSCQPYFAGWRSLGNDRFLAALRPRLGGVRPTALAEALWGQVLVFAAAVSRLDGLDLHPVLVREAARGGETLMPQGRVKLDEDSLHPRLWPKVAVASEDGDFKVIARARQAVAPLPFWGLGTTCTA